MSQNMKNCPFTSYIASLSLYHLHPTRVVTLSNIFLFQTRVLRSLADIMARLFWCSWLPQPASGHGVTTGIRSTFARFTRFAFHGTALPSPAALALCK